MRVSRWGPVLVCLPLVVGLTLPVGAEAPVARAANAPEYHAIALGLTSGVQTLYSMNETGVAGAVLDGGGIARVVGTTVTPIGGAPGIPFGVSDAGTLVGYRTKTPEGYEAVRIDGASVATLSGLGGLYEIAYDIDPSGTTIVGSSTLATGEQSAWVDTGTGANALPSLGGDYSIANKVTSSGLIGGSARTPSGEMHFVTWQAGAVTDHGNLGGNYANLVELNEAGQFIGSIGYPMAGDRTVFWDGSTLVDLGTLGGSSTYPGDMNEAGDVVVSSRTAGGQTHAALWDGGLLVDLGTLGGPDSYAGGINDQGQIVGTSYTAGGRQHGFLLQDGVTYDLNDLVPPRSVEITSAGPISDSGHIVANTSAGAVLLVPGPRPAAAYQVIDLGAPLGSTSGDAAPRDMNASRQATGQVDGRAFLYDGTTTIHLTPGFGGSSGSAINAFGAVAGFGQNGSDDEAFIYDGTLQFLGTLGGGGSYASDLNDARDVVGWAYVAGGQTHAFLYRDGTMIDLHTLAGVSSVATKVNGAGTVIGNYSPSNGQYRGFVSDGTTTTDIGTLGGTTAPYAINEAGVIVGTSGNQAFRYAGTMASVAPPGSTSSEGIAINEHGSIAGSYLEPNGDRRGFLLEDGQYTLIPGMGGSFATTTDINERGLVVGYASTTNGTRGYLFDHGDLIDLSSQLPLGYEAAVEYVAQIGDDGTILARGRTGDFRDRALLLVPTDPDPVPDPLTITPAPGAPAVVAMLGRFEQHFELGRTYGPDVNDPSVIDVTGRFVAPSGATFTVPAYFGLDYTVQPGTGVGFSEGYEPVVLNPPADGIWHVRFSPDEVGTWTYTLRAQDRVPGQQTTSASASMTFQVTPSAAHGQVVRDPRDDRFLRYEDGTPYLPMGHNVAFQQGEPAGNDGEHYVEPLFASMEAAGQNWTQIWMTDFNRNALEWSAGHWAGWYTGVGQYAGQSAFRIERQLDVAEEHSLQVQLVLNDHGQVRSMLDGRWAENPYNAANGGPVDAAHPEQFFTDPEAKSFFKQRLRYLVARYAAYRNLLTWELFNEVQFVGSDTANPFNSAQVRNDIVAWHAEMAAYLRSIDPYDHLITTSSDIESSLKDIWADPNIDVIQVHDYDPVLATRDTRFRGYVASLNAQYQKPVIIGEFGIAGNPEINFDPVTAAPLDDREEHLLQVTHLHNAAWSAAMSGSGAMSWWWGAYIHSSPAFHRMPPDFPANERVNPPLRDFFAVEDLAGMSLENADITVPSTVVALGLDNGSLGFAWIRDAQNEYGTGAGPGNLAGRTMTGIRASFGGFTDGTYRIEVHDPWGTLPVVERLATSVGGTLSVALPDFRRDVAIKIRPVGAATSAQPVTVTITSPNGGPVDVTESTTPSSPPVGSGYTFLAFQHGITAPVASTMTPLTIVFTVDKALLDSADPDLTANTLSVFRNDVPVPSCTAITTDDPATPNPCVSARETLVGGADAGDVRITVLSSAASRWNFGVGPARANQTITFGNLANRTMLQSPVAVTATATSGLAVSFSTTTPTVCTSSGTNGQMITLVGAGTCTVKADQAGNASFNPAPSVFRSFTVSRVSQSISFNNLVNRTMLQTPFTVLATASSSLAVTFASTTPSVCATSGATGSNVELRAAGICTIVASQMGNATYSPALDKARSFTVSRASQTITFTNPGNKSLIQSPVTVSATASSGLPVTFTTTTPAICTSGGANGATITLITTGSCSVVASQAGNANYAPATSITRTFTVGQATQTITFAPLPTANLQQSPITVAATASSGLTVTFATSSGSVCTAGGTNGKTITLLKAGTCKVVASQAGNATYKAAPNVTQTFSVTTSKLAQSITFAALADRSIGAPSLTLSATASSGLAVTYAVAPASAAVCSVSGSVLTLKDPGTCTITASQAGNSIYNAAAPVTRSLTATLGGFVQASGTTLVLDGQPFRIFGAAIYQTANHGHSADPDQIFGWAHDAHLNTLRLTDIFDQNTTDPNAPYAEPDWQWIDSLIARARNEGLKVILDLSSYRNWLVRSAEIEHGWVTNCEPDHDRSGVDYEALDPYTVAHRADWAAFMTFVANRVNTVSGIKYRNDSTILVVSIAGEAIGHGYGECGRASSEQELTDFFTWSLAAWKSLDPHHLRSTGGLLGTYNGLDGNGDPIPTGQQVDGIGIFSLADNTLPSLHTYWQRPTVLPLVDGQTPVLAPVAQDLGKPWFTEEFGFRQDDGNSFRASGFDFVFEEQTTYGSVGSLFWNLGPQVGLETYDVNPSTPLTWARVLAEES